MLDKITLPPVLLRYELKYIVPRDLIEPICHFIAPYCSMDYHSQLSQDHFYTVNSLYYDTRNYEFLNQRLWGKDTRFNMRVRTYGEGNTLSYYLEIKHKTGSAVKKYRAIADLHEWPNILTDPFYEIDTSDSANEKCNKSLFIRLARSYEIEPKIFTQYRRLAFFSTVDEYARLTMDCNMRYREQNQNTFFGNPYDLQDDYSLINYDNETIYSNEPNSGANVILELKCYIGRVPMWMIDLITHFELTQIGFSKYVNASMIALNDNGVKYMPRDRVGYKFGADT